MRSAAQLRRRPAASKQGGQPPIGGELIRADVFDAITIRRKLSAGRAAQGCAIALGVLAAAVTGLELVRPLHTADAGARASIETTITVWSLLSVLLLVRHFRHTRRVHDLLLLGAVAATALTEFVFSALPAVTGSNTVSANGAWTGCVTIVAVSFAAVAFASRRRLLSPGRPTAEIIAIAGLRAIAVAALFELILGNGGAQFLNTAAISPTGDPLLFAATLLPVAVLVVAGTAFVVRGGRADPRSGLMAGVCFLLAASGLQRLAIPAEAAHWVTPGDGLRLVAYTLLLAVALLSCARTRRQEAATTLNQERQRLARDLHDGLAQDLAFIALHAQSAQPGLGPDHPLVVAARRALGASRGMIVDLAARSAPTTAAALRLVADELGTRFEVHVDVSTVPETGRAGDFDLDSNLREEVVRIAREAIVNAISHGGAHNVEVVLDCEGSHPLLLVSDDGRGIPELPGRSRSGFGLPTMRARAESLGGRLITRHGARGGTVLEVRMDGTDQTLRQRLQ